MVTRKTEFIKTKWGESDGFNYYCPAFNGKKTVAGHVPVACGQLMYHYKFPSRYNWDNMELEVATDASAILIAELGEGMRASYGFYYTNIRLNDFISYMEQIGYICREEKSLGQSVVDKMKQNMLAKKPVLLSLGEGIYYLVVVGGMHIQEIYVTDDIWSFSTATRYEIVASERAYSAKHVTFYLNWGRNGVNDGFYKLDNITTNESGKTETWEASEVIFAEPKN